MIYSQNISNYGFFYGRGYSLSTFNAYISEKILFFFFFAKNRLTYIQIDDTDKDSKNQSKNVA